MTNPLQGSDEETRPTEKARCGLPEFSCSCDLDKGHEGPHVCTRDGCGGSWTYDADGNFESVRFPGVGDEASELLRAIFG